MITGGCQNKVRQENERLWEQNRQLQARADELEMRLRQSPDPQSYAQLQAENQRLAAEVANLQASLRQQPAEGPATPGLEGIDATYDAAAGTVTVNLPGDVLFAPGSAELRPGARATLDKIIAAIRKDYAGKRVFVDGHTDSDPIRRTADKWKDNHDLAYHRAKAVFDYMTSHGLDSKQLVLRAFGPNQPKGTKAASRRVEIVVNVR